MSGGSGLQGRLNATDRKLLAGAAVLAVLMTVGTVALGPTASRNQSGVPSSYSASRAGALAAFLLLQDLHYPVRRWEEPPEALAALTGPAVLILAEPMQAPRSSERSSLLKFVRNGGRVLFCGNNLATFFPGPNIARALPGEEWQQFSSVLPSHFTRDGRNITMEPTSSWANMGSQQLALYGNVNAPVVVAWQIGRGEVLWWAAPTPLSNVGIAKSDNLKLFLNATSAAGTSEPIPVYWDEYFHGARASLWSYIAATPVKWALLQLLFLTATLFFTFSRRSGPITTPAPTSRLSPLEFVDTLGGLYERARATSVAIDVAYQHLRLTLAQRLVLPSSTADSALALAAGERLGWDAAKLAITLETADAAQFRKPIPREALKVVQQLRAYTARLENMQSRSENH